MQGSLGGSSIALYGETGSAGLIADDLIPGSCASCVLMPHTVAGAGAVPSLACGDVHRDNSSRITKTSTVEVSLSRDGEITRLRDRREVHITQVPTKRTACHYYLEPQVMTKTFHLFCSRAIPSVLCHFSDRSEEHTS